MKDTYLKFQLLLKNIRDYFYVPLKRGFVHKNVPYYSQWESKELVDKLLKGKVDARDDPKWKRSGAKNKLEYLNWSWNTCGMACFQMVLAHLTGKKIPLVELGKRSLKYGVYKIVQTEYDKGNYLKSIDGLFHKPFSMFARSEFGIRCVAENPLTLTGIIRKLELGNYVMASVSQQIRDPLSEPIKKSGHIVLILGYDFDKRVLYLHNPSGHYRKSQEYAEIKFEVFERLCSSRGIVVYSIR